MKAIILAAGSGIITPRKDEIIPVCLMKIGEETLLERQIKILKKWGINDILVIVGKEGECWSSQNIKKIKSIAKKVIINPLNDRTPSSSSLVLGLEYFRPTNCLILDGDLVFEEGIIKEVLKNKNRRLILLEKIKANVKGTYIKIEGDRVIKIERSNKAGMIYTGLMKIDNILYSHLKKEIRREKDKTLEYPVILNKYLNKYKISAIDIDTIQGDIGDIFNYRPLVGGSFANTRIISKVVKKTANIVRKEAIKGRDKLVDEIRWIKSLPPELAPYFPNITEYNIAKENAWYEMEYYNLQTFRSLLINKVINKKESLHILKILISTMFSKVYNKRISHNTQDYAKRVHISRIIDRLIDSAQSSPIIKKILNSKHITINNKRYLNLPAILRLIEEDEILLKELEPPFLCMVHGDLHFDNFTVDISQKPMIRFILLDPRGLDNTYNYDYDLGKLWFSLDGKYDLTHEGLFDLNYEFRQGDFIASINYNDLELFKTYNSLYGDVKKFISLLPIIKRDKNWELRTLFAEISHYCSNLPFHLKNNKKENIAVALYIRGVKLANEFAQKYCKDYNKEDHHKNYVNINSLEKYKFARELFQNG